MGLSIALFRSNIEQDVVNLREAVEGAGTDEKAIIDILCTRDNGEIELIKRLYEKRFGKELVKDMRGDSSGNFKMILTSLCSGERDERGDDLGEEKATEIAQMLFDEGGIVDTIKGEFSGVAESAYKAIAITALEGR